MSNIPKIRISYPETIRNYPQLIRMFQEGAVTEPPVKFHLTESKNRLSLADVVDLAFATGLIPVAHYNKLVSSDILSFSAIDINGELYSKTIAILLNHFIYWHELIDYRTFVECPVEHDSDLADKLADIVLRRMWVTKWLDHYPSEMFTKMKIEIALVFSPSNISEIGVRIGNFATWYPEKIPKGYSSLINRMVFGYLYSHVYGPIPLAVKLDDGVALGDVKLYTEHTERLIAKRNDLIKDFRTLPEATLESVLQLLEPLAGYESLIRVLAGAKITRFRQLNIRENTPSYEIKDTTELFGLIYEHFHDIPMENILGFVEPRDDYETIYLRTLFSSPERAIIRLDYSKSRRDNIATVLYQSTDANSKEYQLAAREVRQILEHKDLIYHFSERSEHIVESLWQRITKWFNR